MIAPDTAATLPAGGCSERYGASSPRKPSGAGLGGRKLKVFRDGRIVTPLGDLVVDKLPGLDVAV
jgi:hypothetical protein